MTDTERPAQAVRYRSVLPSSEAPYVMAEEARCSVLYSLGGNREVLWFSRSFSSPHQDLIRGNGSRSETSPFN